MDDRRALARLRSLQRLSNDVLATYLARAATYRRDGDLPRLRAERIVALAEDRLAPKSRLTDSVAQRVVERRNKPVPETIVPRRFTFASGEQRNAAWTALRERHGLLGPAPVAKFTEAGAAWYARDREWVKSLTAAQRELGDCGIGAELIHHLVVPSARDRVLAWILGASGRPRFASRRHPLVSVEGSSSAKNSGSLRVDLAHRTFAWKAAGGKHPIGGALLIDERDPWLAKALRRKIHVVRLLHRVEHGRRRWYVQLVLEGLPPLNPRLRDAQLPGTTGVDLGLAHYAAVTMREGAVVGAWIANLAPTAARRERLRDGAVHDQRPDDRRKRDRYVRQLKRRIGQLVARNPANAHARRKRPKKLKRTRDGKAAGKIVEVEGGFRKGVRLVRSARVCRIEAQVAEIARGDAAARDTDHGRAANELLTSAATIALEKLSYRGWQQQFGRQAGRAAVGVLVERLRRRAPLFNARRVVELLPSERLSQVCHACGTLNRYLDELAKPIAARTSHCEGCGRANAQLDLYSAFLAASCGEGTSVDRDVATAAWPGAVELLASARQTYERAVRAALAARRAQALRSSRRNPAGPSQDSAPRGLRSQTRARRGDGPPRERAGGGNVKRSRSSEAGRVSPPHSPGSQEPSEARAGPSLDSCDATPTATRAP